MQEKFISWKDPITSLGANAKYSGILAANVYRGFDVITNIVGLTFKLAHTTTGEVYTKLDETLSNPKGVWVTRQGGVIKEDASLSLTLVTNLGNSFARIDYLIGRHLHDVLQIGGLNATYEIVKGPLGSFTEPTLTHPEDSVILGKFIIPANASVVLDTFWQRNRTPLPGGKLPVILTEDNVLEGQLSLKQKTTKVQILDTDYEIAHRGAIPALDKGNLFVVDTSFNFLDLLPVKPFGTEISLRITSDITIRGFVDNLIDNITGTGIRSGYADGLRGISLNNKMQTLVIKGGQIITLKMVNIGGSFNKVMPGETYEYGDMWKLISVSDTTTRVRDLETALTAANSSISTLNDNVASLTGLINNINVPRSILDIDYVGVLNDDFDVTGKAKNTSPYKGRAICNGQNGTPDYRGRVRVSLDPDTSDYSSVGFVGGNNFVFLDKSQLPAVPLNFSYQWGNWRGTTGSDNYGTMGAIYPNNPSGTGFNRTGTTEPLGSGVQIDARMRFKVALPLMWIGV